MGAVRVNGSTSGYVELAAPAVAGSVVMTLPTTTGTLATTADTAAAGGMVLITPTSVAGSGVTLSGGEVTCSAAASASANGVFTSAYRNYYIVANITNSILQDVLFRLRVAGTDNTTNNYRNSYAYTSTATAWTVGQLNPSTYGLGGWATTAPSLITFSLGNPQSASDTQATITCAASPGSPTVGIYLFSFRKDDSLQYDGITFYTATGSMTGTFRIYGLKNS